MCILTIEVMVMANDIPNSFARHGISAQVGYTPQELEALRDGVLRYLNVENVNFGVYHFCILPCA